MEITKSSFDESLFVSSISRPANILGVAFLKSILFMIVPENGLSSIFKIMKCLVFLAEYLF